MECIYNTTLLYISKTLASPWSLSWIRTYLLTSKIKQLGATSGTLQKMSVQHLAFYNHSPWLCSDGTKNIRLLLVASQGILACRIFYVKCLVKATPCSILFSDTNCAYQYQAFTLLHLDAKCKQNIKWFNYAFWLTIKTPFEYQLSFVWVAAFKLLNLWITNRNDHQVNCRSQVLNTPYMYDGHPTRVLPTSYGGSKCLVKPWIIGLSLPTWINQRCLWLASSEEAWLEMARSLRQFVDHFEMCFKFRSLKRIQWSLPSLFLSPMAV